MVAGSIMVVTDDDFEIPTLPQATYMLFQDLKSIYNYIYALFN